MPIQFELSDYSLGGRAFVGRVRTATEGGRVRWRPGVVQPACSAAGSPPARRGNHDAEDSPRIGGTTQPTWLGQPHHASAVQLRFVKDQGQPLALEALANHGPQRGKPQGFDDVAALFALEIVTRTALESQNPACAGF